MAVFRQLLKPSILRRCGGAFFNVPQLHCAPSEVFNTLKKSQCDCRRFSIEQTSKFVSPILRRGLHREAAPVGGIGSKSDVVPLSTFVKHNEEKTLEVTWRDNEAQKYPYPWLRDSCRCDSCYSHSTYSRNMCFLDLDVEAVPQDVNVSSDGGSLNIIWPDGHKSEYASSWLKENRYDISDDDPVFHPKMRYWGSDLGRSLSVLKLGDILESDAALYEMLMELKTSGICRITGSGTMEGQVKKLADRIAFLHITYFGATDHVKLLPDTTHVAYTTKPFPMHTDLAYKGRPPGAQILHCIQQSHDEGGENWFTDGFKVALDFKKADPDAYDLLCNVPMEFKDIGTYPYGQFYQRSCHPVIGLDRRGHPDHIYLSDHGREPMLRIPMEQVLPVYRALKKFSDVYHHPDNVYVYKLQEGDIMIFDNRRVIHGRAAFKVTNVSSRHLETGYLEWDEIDSRIRILMGEFAKNL